MKAPKRLVAVDLLNISYNALIAEAEEVIKTIKAGNQYQRNNIIDITSETLATATRTRDALRKGMQLLMRTRDGSPAQMDDKDGASA